MEITVTLADKLDPIAVYAALVASIILIWDVIKWLRSNARLRLHASPNMTAYGSAIPHIGGGTFILVTASNVGFAKTTITHLSFSYYSNRWKKLRNKPTSTLVILVPEATPNYKLPYVLEPGEEWTGIIDQNDELVEMVRSGLVYAKVHHSRGKKPVRKRILIPEVADKKSESNC